MSFPAPLARFVLRPRTAWPPDYALPPGWQDWTGGEFVTPMAVWTGNYELRKLQVNFQRNAGVGSPTDVAVTTHHFLNLTNDVPDSTWVDADFVAVETAFDTMWNSLRGAYNLYTTLDFYRWYRDGPAFHPTPAEGNPAVRTVDRNQPGSQADTAEAMPPQVAISVTERTALRKRWGRFYLPAPANDNVDNLGRIPAALCTNVANAVEACYEACIDAGIIPVVFSPTNEAAYSIDEVQVDDLYDVIRSRRWKQPLQRIRRVIS